jgi:chemotaxis signal transduction protein
VVQWSKDEILPPPAFGGLVPAKFIEGLTKNADTFVVLLEVEKLVSDTDVDATAAACEL